MIDQELKELIQRDIDGTTTPAERERVHCHLADSPEARDYYNKLTCLAAELGKVRMVNPPTQLKPFVMARLPHRVDHRQHRSITHGFLEPLWGWLAPRPAFSFALATVAGACLAICGVYLLDRDRADALFPTSGTMGPTAPQVIESIDRQPIRVGDAHGTIAIGKGKDQIEVTISLNATTPTVLELTVEPVSMRLNSYVDAHGIVQEFSVAGNSVRMEILGTGTVVADLGSISIGPARLQVRAAQRDAEIRLELGHKTGL